LRELSTGLKESLWGKKEKKERTKESFVHQKTLTLTAGLEQKQQCSA
jgi:hypothetical protein